MNRDNFDGSTYDSESDLQMLGFRMYDTKTGRFTTPDLLWSAFPAQTPYHYAYNSPLTYRDPTGVAPEKEKEGEELMGVMPGPGDPSEYYVHTEIDYSNPRYNCGLGAMQYASLAEQLFYAMMANGGGGGGRTGTASWAYNGSTTTTTTITNSDGTTTTTTTTNTTYHFTTYIPTTNGTMIVPTDVQQSGISAGETPESVMLAFVGGINDILGADPTYFDGLWGSDVSVNIMNSSEIFANGEPAPAKHGGEKGTNNSVITLGGNVLTGHTKVPNYPDENGGFSPHEPYMIIAHEFAHANHFALTGDNFFSYNWQLQELFAITNTNRIQSFYNDPQRKTWSSIRPIWGMFYKSTWWHYQIYGY